MSFAPPHAGLSLACARLAIYDRRIVEEARPRVITHAHRALELARELADGHEAVRQRSGQVLYAGCHPWLDVLRDDPRRAELLGRMNLEDAST